MPEEANQIREQLRVMTAYAQQNQDKLSPEQKREFVRLARSAMERLAQFEKQEQTVPETPSLIPDSARLLWVASGGVPAVFVEYLKSYPDPSLSPLKDNPQRLIQVLQALAKEYPYARPQDQVQDGVQSSWLPSSNIWGFSYDPSTQSLLVKFNGKDQKSNGPVYQYAGVPKEIFDLFQKGAVPAKTKGRNKWGSWWVSKMPSLGAALSALIKKGSYPYQKVSN